MIDFYKRVGLRNGNPVRDVRPVQSYPYGIIGQARLDGGCWEDVSWTRDGWFCVCPDDEDWQGNPYDLINLEDADD